MRISPTPTKRQHCVQRRAVLHADLDGPSQQLGRTSTTSNPGCWFYIDASLSPPPHGTLVFNWHPCQPFNRSPSTALTILCCFSMFAPRNFSDDISIPYIEPQPPDISCTTSSTGLNSLTRRSHTLLSASLRKSGFSSVLLVGVG